MKADSHLHTYYSADSICPMEDTVKRAIELGLDEITFTDHVEHDHYPNNNCDYDKYEKEINHLNEKYGDRITIRRGIEFSVQDVNMHLFMEDRKHHDFDFIIMSTHSVHGEHIGFKEYEKGKNQDEIHRIYYENLLDLVRTYKDYSILGHVDYIKRYDPYGEYPDDKVMDLIEKIFEQVIADGKGIEVNTSSFKYGLSDLMPSRRILKLYHDMGGRILTIGSDSHDTAHVADHFEEVKDELKKIGFTEFCTFKNMKPIFHTL